MQHGVHLRTTISEHLQRHQRLVVTATELRPAAVAVVVVADDHGRASFLLTRRADGLREHRSQWALPGGRVEPEEDVPEAALRELDEELGVRDVEVLGALDDYATRSGHRITPMVLWAPGTVELRPDRDEVAEAHRVPLDDLLRDDVPRWAQYDGVDERVIQIPLANTRVHAPTGAIIYQFREVALHGRATRVAHLAEPPFAWT